MVYALSLPVATAACRAHHTRPKKRLQRSPGDLAHVDANIAHRDIESVEPCAIVANLVPSRSVRGGQDQTAVLQRMHALT
jgi:hypothetical protein